MNFDCQAVSFETGALFAPIAFQTDLTARETK